MGAGMQRHKLTETQRLVLERLEKGDVLHWMSGYNSYYFWSLTHDCPRSSTISALTQQRLVERVGEYAKEKVVITEAGRAALAASRAEPERR